MGISNIRRENELNQAQRWKCQFWKRHNDERVWRIQRCERGTSLKSRSYDLNLLLEAGSETTMGQGRSGDLGRCKVLKGGALAHRKESSLAMGRRFGGGGESPNPHSTSIPPWSGEAEQQCPSKWRRQSLMLFHYTPLR